MMVCSFLKNSKSMKPRMLMVPLGMRGSCAAASLAPLPKAQKTSATNTNSTAVAARISSPMKAGRGAGVRRISVPGTLPVGTSRPKSSPVLRVRVVGVDELQVDEPGDHDEDHAGQPDEADPVLLQRDAELDLLRGGAGEGVRLVG